MLLLGEKIKGRKTSYPVCLTHWEKNLPKYCVTMLVWYSDMINFMWHKSVLWLPVWFGLLCFAHDTCVSTSVCVAAWWLGPGNCSKREVSKIKSLISGSTNPRSGSLCTWSVPLQCWQKGRNKGKVSALLERTNMLDCSWIYSVCFQSFFSHPRLMVTRATKY